MQVFLALPAYNEERSLPELFESLEELIASEGYPNRIIVVDDGSTDDTRGMLQWWSSRLALEIVRHAENRGLGETIRDALTAAAKLAKPEDAIVSMDADNTHPASLIPRMIERLEEGYGVVIASRYRPGARVVGLSGYRHVMSRGARLLFQLLFPIPGVRDYTCGFRAYRAGVLQEVLEHYQGDLVTERSFASMAEILIKLGAHRVRMCEVPLVLRYDLKGGASKMRVSRTVLRTFCWRPGCGWAWGCAG